MDRRRFVSGSCLLAAFFSRPLSFAADARPTLESASIKSDRNSWTLQNAFLTKRIWWDGEQLRGLVSLGETNRPQDIPGEFFLIVDGKPWPSTSNALKLTAARPSTRGQITTLELVFAAADPLLEITMRYICRDDSPAIEQVCSVRNVGTSVVKVHRCDSCHLSIPLADRTVPEAQWIEGLHGDEKTVDEPYRTYRVTSATLPEGSSLHFESGRWSSDEKLPAITLRNGDQTHFAAIAWSGEWDMTVDRQKSILNVQAGIAETIVSLNPGQVLESPSCFYGLVAGDEQTAWNAIHAHCRASIMPAVPDDFPWVTYNTWYNFGTELHEDLMRQEADRAAALGIEVFYIDDGWFEGSVAKGPWGTGAGNWVENRNKFPSGIAQFAEYVRERKMKFGLWVEPERIDAKYVGEGGLLSRDSLAMDEDQPIRFGFNEDDHQTKAYQVCFGDPKARAWALDGLTRAVRDYKVEWLKWDHNRYGVCHRSDHGHGSGDGDSAHTRGVWAVMDELQKRFPQLIIENCAAGGHRFDYGMMQRTQVTWTSDETAPGHLSRHTVFGAGHAYPLQYLTTWYVPHPKDPDIARASNAVVDTLFRNHMLGAFGISDKLGQWSEKMSASAKRSIALYKRLRPFLRGEVAWLTSQVPLRSPDVLEAPAWEATQLWLAKAGEGVVFAYRSVANNDTMNLKLRFVTPGKNYVISDEDGWMEKRTISGAELLQTGVTVRIPEKNASALIYLKQS